LECLHDTRNGARIVKVRMNECIEIHGTNSRLEVKSDLADYMFIPPDQGCEKVRDAHLVYIICLG
jgi:hypothetical protein